MTPLIGWTIFLFLLGVLLLFAEFFLPTHGFVGLIGAATIIGAIVLSFLIHPWIGAGVLFGSILAAPFVGAWFIKFWPRTPLGRRIMLPDSQRAVDPVSVQIGQTGITISELRPIGICEFNGERYEVLSELGIVHAGQNVKVVRLENRRPVVRLA